MSDTMRVKGAAKLWGITDRRVISLCRNGKIKGAIQNGRAWGLPANTVKPADSRIKTGAYVQSTRRKDLPLPIGISDSRLASTEYYYIDKTMRIKDFLDERPVASLFTRPRRFGKPLNRDMLRTFFERTEKYETALTAKGVESAFKYGVAFSGKRVEIANSDNNESRGGEICAVHLFRHLEN